MRVAEEMAEVRGACAEMERVAGVPPDLTGLRPHIRARVMAARPDCPLDLEGLASYDRTLVMVRRRDCPVDLTGLASYDRAWIMAHRPDCPVDLTTAKRCPWCHGSGTAPGLRMGDGCSLECQRCDGTGSVGAATREEGSDATR